MWTFVTVFWMFIYYSFAIVCVNSFVEADMIFTYAISQTRHIYIFQNAWWFLWFNFIARILIFIPILFCFCFLFFKNKTAVIVAFLSKSKINSNDYVSRCVGKFETNLHPHSILKIRGLPQRYRHICFFFLFRTLNMNLLFVAWLSYDI